MVNRLRSEALACAIHLLEVNREQIVDSAARSNAQIGEGEG